MRLAVYNNPWPFSAAAPSDATRYKKQKCTKVEKYGWLSATKEWQDRKEYMVATFPLVGITTVLVAVSESRHCGVGKDKYVGAFPKAFLT